MYDEITKPHHYGWHPSGVEAKEVTDDLPYWLGDAITCIWRRNHKGQPIDDRLKAIERLNEATPGRLERVWFSAPIHTALSADKIGPKPDYLLHAACQFIQTVRVNRNYRTLQKIIDELKDELRAELDELTANETTRTPTIYEEQ